MLFLWCETQGKFWRFYWLLRETVLGGSMELMKKQVAWCPSTALSDLVRDKAELSPGGSHRA